MNTETKKSHSLVVIYVRFQIVINDPRSVPQNPFASQLFEASERMDRELGKRLGPCKGHFVKLGVGVYLVEEDACYASILSILELCRQQKLQHAIVPVGEQPLTVLEDEGGLQAWLAYNGRTLRLTTFPPQQ